MNFYEELGISPSANSEEIKHAHRRLLRLLHPDLQSDPTIRHLAELQTLRANAMAETLLDAQSRREYDQRLCQNPNPPNNASRSIHSPYLIALIGLPALLILILTIRPETQVTATPPNPVRNSPTTGTASRTGPTTSSASKRELPLPRLTLAQPAPQQTEETLSASPGIETATLRNTAQNTEPLNLRVQHDIDPTATEPPPEKQITQNSNPLAGTWIYVPSPRDEKQDKLYRPEYIEMRIQQNRGQLLGTYQARYRVTDRALDPNVRFHFEGTTNEAQPTFDWTGANGSGGNVKLKPIGDNSVQVDWRVTQKSNSADLTSGTAVLTRMQ